MAFLKSREKSVGVEGGGGSLQSVISRNQGRSMAVTPPTLAPSFSFLKNLSGGGGWMVWDGDGDG